MITLKKINIDALNKKEKEMIKELGEAIEKKMKEAECESEDEDECEDGITPAEELSINIAVDLAQMIAERLDEVLLETSPDIAEKLIRRLEHSQPETMVCMIQSMFLMNGMTFEAEALDLLRNCEEFDDLAYSVFKDELFDSDLFDSVRIADLFEERFSGECAEIIRFPLEVIS